MIKREIRFALSNGDTTTVEFVPASESDPAGIYLQSYTSADDDDNIAFFTLDEFREFLGDAGAFLLQAQEAAKPKE